ncbi:unnamed protein product [Bemisia tabaci]|nr:unnamed protein product [Bemisia tabaci]
MYYPGPSQGWGMPGYMVPGVAPGHSAWPRLPVPNIPNIKAPDTVQNEDTIRDVVRAYLAEERKAEKERQERERTERERRERDRKERERLERKRREFERAREEAERKTMKEAAEKKAKEEEERKIMKEAAEKKAKEEAERKIMKEAAEKKAREEEEKKMKEEAEKQDQVSKAKRRRKKLLSPSSSDLYLPCNNSIYPDKVGIHRVAESNFAKFILIYGIDPKNINIKDLFRQLMTHPALVQALQPPSLQGLPIVQPQPQAVAADTTSTVQPQPKLSEQRQVVPTNLNVEPQLQSKPLAEHPLNSKDIFANTWQSPSTLVTNLNLALSTAFKKRKLKQERTANSPRPIIFQRQLVLLSKGNFCKPINKAGDELYLGQKKIFAEEVKFNRLDSNHLIKEKTYQTFSEKLKNSIDSL